MAGTTVASLVVRITASVTEFEKAMAGMEKKWARQGAKFQQIGRDLTAGLTLPIAAIGGLAVKAASDFESSFAGVKKTVNATAPEFAHLAAGIRKMATEIPVGVNELNKIAELGGQLGIQTGNILDFTRVIADMGVTTSLSTEEAAMGMAQFASMTQMSQKDFGRLGSTIVALGNDMATTEPKILDFSLRIGAVGKSVGLTQAEIVGLSAAMAAVGIEAEMGGTAVSKALQSMNMAAQTGKGTGVFGAAAGMSGGAFAKLFNESPIEGLAKVMEGVGAAGKMGAPMLKALGFDDARQVTAFMSLAGAGHKLREAIALANKEWERGKALSEEAAIRYGTFASQMTIFKNRLQDVAISAGQQLIPALQRMMPAVETLIGALATAVNWFSKLPTSVQLGAFAFAGFVAAAGPVTFAVGTIVKAFGAMAGAVKLLSLSSIGSWLSSSAFSFTAAAGGASTLSMVLLALGKAVTVVGAAFVGWNIGKWIDSVTGASDKLGVLLAYMGEAMLILPKGSVDAAKFHAGNKPIQPASMISPAGAERLSDAERLAAQLAEANQRALNPQLFAKADAERMKLVEAAQKAEEAAKQAQQAEEQRLESIANLRRELTGATAIAAAVEMQAALQGVDLANLEVEARQRINDVLAKGIKLMGEKAPQAMRDMASATMPRLEEVGDSMQNIASLAGTMTDEIRDLSMVTAPMPPLVEELPSAAENMANLASMTASATDQMRQMSGVQAPKWWTDIGGLTQVLDAVSRIPGVAGAVGAALGGALGGGLQSASGLTQMLTAGTRMTGIANTISGLTNAALSIWEGTNFGSTAGKIGGGAASGAMTGAAIGSVIPGLGTAVGAGVGAGVGALVGFVKSRMVSQEEKDARKEALTFQNELLNVFLQTATAAQLSEAQGEKWRLTNIAVRDAYLAIGKSEADAMRDLEAFNNATRVSAEAVQQAAAVIGAAFDEQAADQERLNSAIQRYGFEWAELGAKFRQTQLNTNAKELMEDWRVLVASGIAMETVNTRMADAMNAYLQSALTVGAEVPLAMRPILESFANQGLLVDAAGNKITDLSAAGVNFAETMTAGFDRIIVKLDQLINSLIAAGTAINPVDAGQVASANGQAEEATKPGTYRDWVVYFESLDGHISVKDMIQAAKNASEGLPIPALAMGGIVNGPTLALIGEAGPEAVVPLDEYEGGGRGGFTVIVQGDVYGYDDFAEKVARGYHDKIEQGGANRSRARQLGLVN